jgi:hypothetical protein
MLPLLLPLFLQPFTTAEGATLLPCGNDVCPQSRKGHKVGF